MATAAWLCFGLGEEKLRLRTLFDAELERAEFYLQKSRSMGLPSILTSRRATEIKD